MRARRDHPRGYLVSWDKLLALLREAGLRLVDLSEPGKRTQKRLVSNETLRKWRGGRRASIDSLVLVAHELTKHARRAVDWRDLVEDGDIRPDLERGRRAAEDDRNHGRSTQGR